MKNLEKEIGLRFKKVTDFKGDHEEAIIVMNEEGRIGYGRWLKNDNYDEGVVELSVLSNMIEPDFILSIHDVVEALGEEKPVKSEITDKERSKLHEKRVLDMNKPPIGEVPIYIWKERRVQTIREAMRRYLAEDKIIPANWLNELTDLYIDLSYN